MLKSQKGMNKQIKLRSVLLMTEKKSLFKISLIYKILFDWLIHISYVDWITDLFKYILLPLSYNQTVSLFSFSL